MRTANGKVEITPSNKTINEHDEPEEPEEELEGLGQDYADDDLAGVDVVLDDKMFAITVEDVDDNCCRPVKMKCQADAKTKSKTCFEKKGKVACNDGKITCKALKDFVSKKAKKQKGQENIVEESKKGDKGDNKNSEEDDDESTEDNYQDTYEDSSEEKKETK